MELQNQSDNKKKYPSGLTTMNESDEYVPRTVNSNESKVPINELVELGCGSGGKYGGSVNIHAEPSGGVVNGGGITLTKEVDQSSTRVWVGGGWSCLGKCFSKAVDEVCNEYRDADVMIT